MSWNDIMRRVLQPAWDENRKTYAARIAVTLSSKVSSSRLDSSGKSPAH